MPTQILMTNIGSFPSYRLLMHSQLPCMLQCCLVVIIAVHAIPHAVLTVHLILVSILIFVWP
jgi:hypothetical protein